MNDMSKIETGIQAIKELTRHVPQKHVQTLGETVFDIVHLMFKQESARLNLYGMEVLEVFEVQRDSADQYDTLEFLRFLLNITKGLDKGSLSFYDQKLLCLPAWKCLYEVTLNENDQIIRNETSNILPVVLEGMANGQQEIRELSTKILRTLTKSALEEDGKDLLVHVEGYLTREAGWMPYEFVAQILHELVNYGFRVEDILLEFLQKLDLIEVQDSLLIQTRIIHAISWLWEERIKNVGTRNPAGIITLLLEKVINILKSRDSTFSVPSTENLVHSFLNQVLKSVTVFCHQISGGDCQMAL